MHDDDPPDQGSARLPTPRSHRSGPFPEHPLRKTGRTTTHSFAPSENLAPRRGARSPWVESVVPPLHADSSNGRKQLCCGRGRDPRVAAIGTFVGLVRYSAALATAGREPLEADDLEECSRRLGLPVVIDGKQYTGDGVVVGIVDTGADASHPAFKDRILSAWDQQSVGLYGRPSDRGWGFILDGDDTRYLTDPEGHGTHVAAIAAGSNHPVGVAPGSDLVIVRCDKKTFGIQAGVAWIFEIAESLGRPAVVNVSWGGVHLDPHDGTDSLSEALDHLVGPGRLVCVAAGNEQHMHLHVRVELGRDEQFRIPFMWGGPPSLGDLIWLSGWCSGELPSAVGIEIEGERIIASGSGAVETATLGNTPAYVVTDWASNRPGFRIGIRPQLCTGGQVREQGKGWLLLNGWSLTEPTRIDVWSNGQGLEFFDHTRAERPAATSVSDESMLASPACANGVITVGAVYGLLQWTNRLGLTITADRPVGQACAFSNSGPTMDNRQKPEAAAAGFGVRSARSRQFGTQVGETDADILMVGKSGTSMAAPQVTGLLALGLEATNGELDPDGARAALISAGGGRAWNRLTGWGEPDATRFVAGLLDSVHEG